MNWSCAPTPASPGSDNHVIRDMQVTLGTADIDALKFEGIYLDANNQERLCYHLPRFECDLMVSGHSLPHLTATIREYHREATTTSSGTCNSLWVKQI